MPWKESSMYEERMKFVIAWKQGGWTMTDLCEEFGISRVTGYKYLEQYKSEGLDGLKNKSRAPKKQAKSVPEKMVELILDERNEHPTWGARKLLASLKAQYRNVKAKDWPCSSTVGRILKRNGLIAKKKRIKRPVQNFPFAHAVGPNDVWCTDFKGWFTVGDGKRCDPLTTTDAHSRFLLGCQGVSKTNSQEVQESFEILFREYGMPSAIRSDNGPPFASTGLAGLTPLAVWWLKLGIQLERIEPGKPQQNGRHERMHKTLKQETGLPPRSSLTAQQSAFDEFRQEYNFIRPHEALDNKFPCQVYAPSKRAFPEKLPEVAYPTNFETVRVNDVGNIGCCRHRVFMCSSLREELVGLEETSDRHVRVYFCSWAIGIIDTYTGKLLRYRNPAPVVDKT